MVGSVRGGLFASDRALTHSTDVFVRRWMKQSCQQSCQELQAENEVFGSEIAQADSHINRLEADLLESRLPKPKRLVADAINRRA